METPLVLLLMLATFGAVLLFIKANKSAVESRLDNDDAPKSTLAKDKADDGKPADV